MGGCATKPKDLNGQNPEDLPEENTVSKVVDPKPVNDNVSSEEVKTEEVKNEDVEKETKEEPLVDLSTPKAVPPVSDKTATEEPTLVSELSELKTDALPKQPTDLGEIKEDVPKSNKEEVSGAQQVDKSTEQKEEKVAAGDNKIAAVAETPAEKPKAVTETPVKEFVEAAAKQEKQ